MKMVGLYRKLKKTRRRSAEHNPISVQILDSKTHVFRDVVVLPPPFLSPRPSSVHRYLDGVKLRWPPVGVYVKEQLMAAVG